MPAGFVARAAFKREATIYASTWPTPAAVATELLPLLSESVGLKLAYQGVGTTDSRSFTSNPLLVSRSVSGDVSVAASYSGLEYFLTAALGFMEPTLPELLDTGVYRHLIEIDPVLSAQSWLADEGWVSNGGLLSDQKKMRRFTYVLDKETALWEVQSCMLNGLNFQANPAACTFTTGLVGYEVSYSTVVGNNLRALSLALQSVIFPQGTFYLGELAPLTSANEVHDLVGISINLESNIGISQTVDTRTQISEPKRTGPVVVHGTFAIPFYTSTAARLEDWTYRGTSLMGLLEFVGPAITEDYNLCLRFWLPQIKLTSCDSSITGAAQFPQNYSFVSSPADTLPEDFPTNIKNGPLMIELVNTNSNHALLD